MIVMAFITGLSVGVTGGILLMAMLRNAEDDR